MYLASSFKPLITYMLHFCLAPQVWSGFSLFETLVDLLEKTNENISYCSVTENSFTISQDAKLSLHNLSWLWKISFYYWRYLWSRLTHYIPLVSFNTPRKHQKTRVFWCFQGVSKETSGMEWFNMMKTNTFKNGSEGY